mmetsp:Transcript_41662/g.99912  ORF Transcript_41662/g.99912 Transcript_41662/m.99912 type:complete len:1104 (+) Transcript_41662:269-3580(+)
MEPAPVLSGIDDVVAMERQAEQQQQQPVEVSSNPTVMAGTDATAGLATGSSPRRSVRDRVSTTMMINGHTVLRKNNYSVTADSYIFDDHDGDDENEGMLQTPAVGQQQPRKKPSSTGPRVETAAEIARRTHKEAVHNVSSQKHHLKMHFLAKNVEILEPFCEETVINQLKEIRGTEHFISSTSNTNHLLNIPVHVPSTIKATLRPYQKKGLDFLVRMHRQNVPAIIGDEMGLGKTLQTITFLSYLKEHDKIKGPSLVICPLSVLSSWTNEIERWSNLKCFRLHASGAEEQKRQKELLRLHATEYDIILTTYDQIKLPLFTSFYQRLAFHYLVLDEGHKIKGHETQIAQTVRKIHCGNKLILTGTPLQNNLVELWAILAFLLPQVFTTLKPFEEHFSLDVKNVVVDKEFLALSQRLLHLFMLRRLKKDVEQGIPPKLETKVYCPLSKPQKFWYKALLKKDWSALEKMQDKKQQVGASQHTVLRSLFMQLRKACSHPFLFDGAEDDVSSTTVEELIGASGKLSVLDMILLSLYKKGNRSVLFSQFTSTLDIIEDYCILRGWKYCRLDGGTSRADRNYLIRRFNEKNSPYFLFLVSTKSGGMGLNLQTADTAILFDSDWNPQNDLQAMGRVHRIGQTKCVHVYRLVTSGTVEERMLERAEKKLLLEAVNKESNGDALVIEEDTQVRGLSAAELFEDITFGCNAIFGESSNHDLPSTGDIEVITDRSRKESDTLGRLKGDTTLNAGSFDASKEFLSKTQFFGGADFREIRKMEEARVKKETPKNLRGIAHLWKEIQNLDSKRSRTQRIVNLNGKGSGYGRATVPVLASNNYDLMNGESSVFSRELSGRANKANFKDKKKKVEGPTFENQEYCQVCGDGGSLACCPRCPCSVHLSCVGLRRAKDLMKCTHHNCSTCGKNRNSAGGLLYPCEACAHAFCEDCLPESGVTFLEKVDRFEKLGFDSTKHVAYIHCSSMCQKYSIAELGYVPPRHKKSPCPEPVNISGFFGPLDDVEKVQNELKEEQDVPDSSSGRHRQSGINAHVSTTTTPPSNTRRLDTSSSTLTSSPTPKKLKRTITPDETDTKAGSAVASTQSGRSAVDAIEILDDSP